MKVMTRSTVVRTAITATGLLIGACSGAPQESRPSAPSPAANAPRVYLLERVDDAAVVQLYADGFASLPLKEKTLIWHLYQAALAGRDIYYDQVSPFGLDMRRVLETVMRRPDRVDSATLPEIQRYTKLFWLNSGPYDNLTGQK